MADQEPSSQVNQQGEFQLQTGETAPPSGDDILAKVEQLRQELHQEIDARFDEMLRAKFPDIYVGPRRCIPFRDGLPGLKGTKPQAVTFPGRETVPVKTWRQAALAIMRDCCSDPVRLERLMDLRGKLNGNFRHILSNRPDGMGAPLEIAENLYMEGDFDTDALLRILSTKVLPWAGYDHRGVMFQLRESAPPQRQTPARKTKAPQR